MIEKLLADNPVILAPMTGILNGPLRAAFMRHAWRGEWIGTIDADAIARRSDGCLINILGKEESFGFDGTPHVIQLIGNHPDTMIRAAVLLESQADMFDVNLGCPLSIATARGMGVALLNEPDRAVSLITNLVRAVSKPLTVKLRLIPDRDSAGMLSLVQRLEDSGVSGLVVHGRTPRQGFAGAVDWKLLRQIREVTRLPLIANGGLRTVEDLVRCRKITGCDGFMVGIGALHDPFLARNYAEYLATGSVHGDGGVRRNLAFALEYGALSCAAGSRFRGRTGRWMYALQFFVLRTRTAWFAARHSH